MKHALFAVLISLVLALPTMAQGDDGLIRKASSHSVKVTLDRLEAVLKKKGITVFARIDHAAGAAKAGAQMPPTAVLIFGNPKLGTPLMLARREIGIDLPLKALAWRDGNGKVWLAYNTPGYLKTRHHVEERDKVFMKMGKALDGLTNAAIKP